MRVEVNGKEYKVKVAITDEEMARGLQGVTKLPEDEGMLFIYEEPQTTGFWMDSTEIPLDIVFINEDEEVISVYHGQPNDRTIAEEDNVKYVLEVNAGSGIKEGDEVDIEDDEDDSDEAKMMVLGPNGEVQMKLEGGERIISRKETKVLVNKAIASYKVKNNVDQFSKKCKSLGKYIFKVLDKQDSRSPEYVESPK